MDLIWEILFGSTSDGLQTAFIPALMAIGGVAQMAMGYDWGGKRREALTRARGQYQRQKNIYKGLDTTVESNVENTFMGLQNQFRGLENVFEDLTVNQQQAQFERQQFQQSQADIMQGMRGAAGGSGVAGLAQIMSNQAMTQAQKASASIGQQEAKNRILAAQQEARIQQLEATEGSKLQQLQAKGEYAAQVKEYEAQVLSMQMEQSKQGTLLGMDAQQVAGAQQSVMAGQQQMAQGFGTALGGVMGAYTPGVGGAGASMNWWGGN